MACNDFPTSTHSMMRGNFAIRSTSKSLFHILAAAILVLLLTTGYLSRSWIAKRVERYGTSRPPQNQCLPWQQQNLGIVVKTGASEALEKLSVQLQTTLSCAESLLIVADLDFELENHFVHDVIKDVSPSVRDKDPVFKFYNSQRRLKDQGYSLQEMSRTLNASDLYHRPAWDLDKYKFLHMLNRVHADMPGKDWYMFIEVDTYLNWANLLAWIAQLDPTQKLYIGSPSFLGTRKFNNGGSGYLLSAPALRAFAVEHPDMATSWDERISKECCGDYVLTLALDELGIPASGAWPMLSGEPPLQIPFGPAIWCQPVIALHHVTPTDVRAMWAFEKELDRIQRQMLFQDLYKHCA